MNDRHSHELQFKAYFRQPIVAPTALTPPETPATRSGTDVTVAGVTSTKSRAYTGARGRILRRSVDESELGEAVEASVF